MFQRAKWKSQSKRDWGAWWLAEQQARWSQPGTRLERHARRPGVSRGGPTSGPEQRTSNTASAQESTVETVL